MTDKEFSNATKSFFLLNLQKFATNMQIMFEIEMAIAGNEHPICLGIKECVKNNLPVDIILANLRAMATTKFESIADLVGNELTNKILAS